jgi:hypothetical protein
MMTSERLANFIEGQLADKLRHFNDSEVVRFTPSIVEGRRYIGFKIDDQQFTIEINVKELKN